MGRARVTATASLSHCWRGSGSSAAGRLRSNHAPDFRLCSGAGNCARANPEL